MSPIRCEIITQERRVFDQAVEMVIAPGTEGELGILEHHVPLITALKPGELRVKLAEGEESFAVSGGFMEVQPHQVTVLATTAEHADEIDIARAEAARERAAKLLEEGPPDDIDAYRGIEAALRRSRIRLKVAAKRRAIPPRAPMLGANEE